MAVPAKKMDWNPLSTGHHNRKTQTTIHIVTLLYCKCSTGELKTYLSEDGNRSNNFSDHDGTCWYKSSYVAGQDSRIIFVVNIASVALRAAQSLALDVRC